jgi:hypothetical protein
MRGDDSGEFGEVGRCVAIGPSTTVLLVLGKIPVVQGDQGSDVVCEQFIDQA